jgi:OOP family OmpA-OmpF porin
MKLQLLVIAAALALTASAQAAGNEGAYIVGSVGSSKIKQDKAEVDASLTSFGVTDLVSSLDDKDTGYKIALGYQYNPNFAVEVGYVDLGKTKYSATGTISGSSAAASAQAKVNGWGVSAVGILPINNEFSLFGKIGTINANVETSASASGIGGSVTIPYKSRKWKGAYGVGASYAFSKAAAVRVEYEIFSKLGDDTIGKSDVDLLSIGIAYKF